MIFFKNPPKNPPLRSLTKNDLLTYLERNNDLTATELLAIISEILRRMIENGEILKK